MSSFTDPLVITPLDDGRTFRLVSEFDYHVGSETSSDYIHVPAGFVTDFASVPQPFWSAIPPWGKYGKAAVVHDYLYGCKDRSRKAADGVFLEAMCVLGVPWWERTIMWAAVRIGGYWAWRNHT